MARKKRSESIAWKGGVLIIPDVHGKVTKRVETEVEKAKNALE